MKKLVDGNIDNQNGAKIRDLERKKPILVYPEGFTGKKVSKKIAVPGMVDLAKKEAQRLEELFEQIDDSGASRTRSILSSRPAQQPPVSER